MKKQLSSQAAAAKMIRAELKAAFPTVKFSVTSSSYSMGDSVRIEWTDGATSEQVNAITKKYQYGSFDGMTDCYNNDNDRSDIPQTKYVMAQRTISDHFYMEFFEYIKKHFKGCEHLTDLDKSDQELNKNWRAWTARDLGGRYLYKIDLTNGLNVERDIN